MPISNFPSGFKDGVSIQNMPVLNTYPEKVYWVDSNNGSNGNDGSFSKPWATVAYAVTSSKFTASRGGIVMVKAGHAETISAAAGIDMSKAGVSVIGLGVGDNRPNFTFSATASTWAITAANCSIENVIMTAGIDSVVKAVHIQAAGARVYNVEFVDTTDIEFVTAILTTTAANNLTVKIKYRGYTGGNAHVATVQLVGADEAWIDVDFHGLASTAVVNFITTACTGVRISGYFYNSGTTDGTKNVVDTQGSSTWWADIVDGAAGYPLKFGSAYSAASALTAAAMAAPRIVTKTVAAWGTSFTTGASPVTLFTVTGAVKVRVWAYGTTAVTSTLNNGTIAIGVASATGGLIAATTMDGTNFPTSWVWTGDTSPATVCEAFSGTSLNWAAIGAGQDIIATIATNSATAGAGVFVCEWVPISAGATVVAA